MLSLETQIHWEMVELIEFYLLKRALRIMLEIENLPKLFLFVMLKC